MATFGQELVPISAKAPGTECKQLQVVLKAQLMTLGKVCQELEIGSQTVATGKHSAKLGSEQLSLVSQGTGKEDGTFSQTQTTTRATTTREWLK